MKRDEALALLPEYALEVLSEAERAGVEAWLDDPDVRAELRALSEDLTDLGAGLAPVTPSDDVRARLLASAAGPDRYSAVMADIAKYCDLAIDAVRAVLRQVDDATKWEPGPMPGIQIQHFDHGPAAVGTDTGFIRYPPGLVFPQHRHLGQEITIVLDGGFTDADGRVYGPGDVVAYADGTAHNFTVGPQGLTVVICFSGYEPIVD